MKVPDGTLVSLRTECRLGFLTAVISMVFGCAAIAKAALAVCDADKDGKITDQEFQRCLALQSALDRVDSNQDKSLDETEISNRIAAYATMSKYIVADVFVKQGKRPLSNAGVSLTLSNVMGADPVKFVATTDSTGIGMPNSSPPGLLGLPPGLYDVEVVHGGKSWNFGVEMADDNPTVNRLEFDLKDN